VRVRVRDPISCLVLTDQSESKEEGSIRKKTETTHHEESERVFFNEEVGMRVRSAVFGQTR
jgi:hypothetical protein